MKLLKPVQHPRLWLTCAIIALAAVTAILILGAFFPELRNLKLMWGLGFPLSLASWWPMSVWRRAYHRAKRISRGHCAYCDYDLTGNTSGICPECGRRVGEAEARGRGRIRTDE